MSAENRIKGAEVRECPALEAVTLDLDGTVYMGDKAIDGAADFVRLLRDQGIKLLFVTNRANRLPETIVAQLTGMGIDCTEEDILTASQATADQLKPGPAYIIGEIGLEQILLEKGFTITDRSPEYVIVSFDRSFDYEKLKTACQLIHNGAQFIATNPDQALVADGGILPGTGSIVAAVETGCGVSPTIIGKPEPAILETAARRMDVDVTRILALGDNVHTDLPSGIRAGMMTALILTGISTRKDVEESPFEPTYVIEDYSELASIVRSLI